MNKSVPRSPRSRQKAERRGIYLALLYLYEEARKEKLTKLSKLIKAAAVEARKRSRF